MHLCMYVWYIVLHFFVICCNVLCYVVLNLYHAYMYYFYLCYIYIITYVCVHNIFFMHKHKCVHFKTFILFFFVKTALKFTTSFLCFSTNIILHMHLYKSYKCIFHIYRERGNFALNAQTYTYFNLKVHKNFHNFFSFSQ